MAALETESLKLMFIMGCGPKVTQTASGKPWDQTLGCASEKPHCSHVTMLPFHTSRGLLPSLGGTAGVAVAMGWALQGRLPFGKPHGPLNGP